MTYRTNKMRVKKQDRPIPVSRKIYGIVRARLGTDTIWHRLGFLGLCVLPLGIALSFTVQSKPMEFSLMGHVLCLMTYGLGGVGTFLLDLVTAPCGKSMIESKTTRMTALAFCYWPILAVRVVLYDIAWKITYTTMRVLWKIVTLGICWILTGET